MEDKFQREWEMVTGPQRVTRKLQTRGIRDSSSSVQRSKKALDGRGTKGRCFT